MWLLIQSDRCPNKKEIRTQTHRGMSTWGLGEDGHLHNQQRGLGRCAPGPRPSLRLPELTGNRRLPLPRPGGRLQLRWAPEAVGALSSGRRGSQLTPPLDGGRFWKSRWPWNVIGGEVHVLQ